jgi:phosphate/phosphite/phosphonate ABC transporter binding protein
MGSAETSSIERFGLAPSAGAERVGQYIRPLADYLASRMGDRLQFSILKSFGAVAEDLRARRISFAWLSPLTYAWAADSVQLLLRSVRADSETYHGVLFALAGSPLRRAEDLAGKRVGWVSRDSMAGYALPALGLRELGVAPAKEAFIGTHAGVVEAVMSGAIDAGATFCSMSPHPGDTRIVSAGWTTTVDVGSCKFRSLARFGPIPGDVLCAAPGVPVAMREGFVETMLHIQDAPGGLEILRGLFGADRFSRAEPADYLKLRTVLAEPGDRRA